MDNNMITYLIISGVVGFLVGFIFFSLLSPKARKYTQVKKDLDATLDELNIQRQMMVKHFSHSAEILDNMAKEFRRLYQHMAENSSQFMESEEMAKIQATNSARANLTIKRRSPAQKQPVDYPPDSLANLLKNQQNRPS